MRAMSAVRFVLTTGCLSAGCLTAGVAGMSCAGNHGPQMHAYIADQITDMSNADIPKEVNAAIAKGDYRFVGINGLGTMVPGVDDADLKLVKEHYGVRMIENTSDSPRNKQEEELQTVAWGYAEQYNRLLRRKLPAGH